MPRTGPGGSATSFISGAWTATAGGSGRPPASSNPATHRRVCDARPGLFLREAKTMARIEAVAKVIRAAGFDFLADQFLQEPERRAEVLRDKRMRTYLVTVLGTQPTDRFYRLAYECIS